MYDNFWINEKRAKTLKNNMDRVDFLDKRHVLTFV